MDFATLYVCDGCERPCRGADRYHCIDCRDFDYCTLCAQANGFRCRTQVIEKNPFFGSTSGTPPATSPPSKRTTVPQKEQVGNDDTDEREVESTGSVYRDHVLVPEEYDRESIKGQLRRVKGGIGFQAFRGMKLFGKRPCLGFEVNPELLEAVPLQIANNSTDTGSDKESSNKGKEGESTTTASPSADATTTPPPPPPPVSRTLIVGNGDSPYDDSTLVLGVNVVPKRGSNNTGTGSDSSDTTGCFIAKRKGPVYVFVSYEDVFDRAWSFATWLHWSGLVGPPATTAEPGAEQQKGGECHQEQQEEENGLSVEDVRNIGLAKGSTHLPMVAIWMKNCVDWVITDLAVSFVGATLVPIEPDCRDDNVQHILALTDACCVVTEPQFLDRLGPLCPPTVKKIILTDPNGNGSFMKKTYSTDAFYKSQKTSNNSAAISSNILQAYRDPGFKEEERKKKEEWRANRDAFCCDAITPIHKGLPRSAAVGDGVDEASTTLSVHLLDDLVAAGDTARSLKLDKDEDGWDVVKQRRSPEDLYTLLFTSGSTGRPKGVITNHNSWDMSSFGVGIRDDPFVVFSFQPFSYSAGREGLWRVLSNGGRVAIFRGIMSSIFDHVQAVRPSSFSGPPRLWNMLFQMFHLESRGLSEEAKQDLYREYSKKLGDRVRAVGFGGSSTKGDVQNFLRETFFSKMVYESYGTTEAGGITFDGTVASTAQVKLLDVPGTEFLLSHKPHPRGEICVRTPDSTPGYWRDAENTKKLFHIDENGVRWIRTGDVGELEDGIHLKILDRNRNVVKLANSTFVSLQAIEVAFHGALDDAEDLFAYAENGWEFPLAVVSLRNSTAAAIDDGSTTADGPSTPNVDPDGTIKHRIMQHLQTIGAEKGLPATHIPHGLVISPVKFTQQNRLVTTSLKLAREELKKRFIHDLQQLYDDLTALDVRQQSIDFFSNAGIGMEPMGSADLMFNKDDDEETAPASDTSSETTATGSLNSMRKRVSDVVLDQYQRVLRVPNIHLQSTARELGADSISVALLRGKLKEKFTSNSMYMQITVDLSYQALWSLSVNQVIDLVTTQVKSAMVSGGSIHRSASTEFYTPAAKELGDAGIDGGSDETSSTSVEKMVAEKIRRELDKYSDLSPIELNNDGERKDCSSGEVVLLTGATGFIGNEILRSLLMIVATTGSLAKVVCLIRGSSTASSKTAIERLKAACPQGTDYPALVPFLEAGTLEVLDADLSQCALPPGGTPSSSYFGLSTEDLKRLQNEVTCVIHCGAWVNHVLPFTELAASNLGATQILLRLFTTPAKASARFWFISTGSVQNLTQTEEEVGGPKSPATSQDRPILNSNNVNANATGAKLVTIDRESLPVLPELDDGTLGSTHLSGYELSKWASERLVQRAFLQLGVHQQQQQPASAYTKSSRLGIIRCGMTSWHSRYGHGNRNDWLTALCNGIAKMGNYPGTEETGGGRADPLHLNVTPVDWVADVVTFLSLHIHEERKKKQQGTETSSSSSTAGSAVAAPLPILTLTNHSHVLSLRKLFRGPLACKPQRIEEWKDSLRQRGGSSSHDESAATVPPAIKRLADIAFMLNRGAPRGDRPTRTNTALHRGPSLELLTAWFGPELAALVQSELWTSDPRLQLDSHLECFAAWLKQEA